MPYYPPSGGGSSSSAGLAGTGFYYIVGSSTPLLPISKIITAGSSVTTHTDATSFYINAITSGGGGVVYAPTGGPYIAYNSDSTLTSELILRAGSSVTVHTDSTFFYINATTGAGGSTSKATIQLPPQAAKLYANNSAARIDAGTGFWRLLFAQATQQYAQWMFVLDQDYSSAPYVRVLYGADSSLAAARSINWVVSQWGVAPNQARGGGYYSDTFGGANTVSIALSAGYSSGLIQSLTIPLATVVSFGAGNLIKLRLTASSGLMGNAEIAGATLEYTKQ